MTLAASAGHEAARLGMVEYVLRAPAARHPRASYAAVGGPNQVVSASGSPRWVGSPTMRATVDREEFFQFQHGDGRLKLVERLAAADRAGELPDYMLEFVDSLRTRAKPPTS